MANSEVINLAKKLTSTTDPASDPRSIWQLLDAIFSEGLLGAISNRSFTAPFTAEKHVSEPLFKNIPLLLKALILVLGHVSKPAAMDACDLVVNFSARLHERHRLLLREDMAGKSLNKEDESALSKVNQSAFLCCCCFFHRVLELSINWTREEKIRAAAMAISCMGHVEFCRVQFEMYGELIRNAVRAMDGQPALNYLTERLPSFQAMEGESVEWTNDSVQTRLVLYWLRILPHCIQHATISQFTDRVAPLLFLCLEGSDKELNGASHVLFCAFLQSKSPRAAIVDPAAVQFGSDGYTMLEKLTLHFILLSLKAYPAVTEFDSLSRAVVCAAMYLPAGSPVVALTIQWLAKGSKAHEQNILQSKAFNKEELLSKVGTGNEGAQKGSQELQNLLFHLIPVVDIQLLPILLQEVQAVIMEAGEGHEEAMVALYKVLLRNDDLTRKPFTVPLYQSLLHHGRMKNRRKEHITWHRPSSKL